MTLTETGQLIMAIKGYYPSYMAHATEAEILATTKLWHDAMKDCDYGVARAAVKAVALTRKSDFAPSIGAIMGKIHELTHGPAKSGLEAWPYVLRAVRNSSYNAEAEFNALPADIRQAVGSCETLRSWARLPEDELNNAQARFIRSYEATEARRREFETMPKDIQTLVQKTRLSLTGGKEEHEEEI